MKVLSTVWRGKTWRRRKPRRETGDASGNTGVDATDSRHGTKP
jgi:hypothetical protein